MAGTLQKITWSAFLSLVLFAPHVLCCVKCDSTGKSFMQTFKYVVKNKHEEDEGAYSKLKQYVAAASKNLMEEVDGKFLDRQAIFEITDAYRRCVELFEESSFEGVQFINLIGTEFKKLKENFRVILAKFSKRVCPNKKGEFNCGIMIQTFTTCETCEEEKLVCVGGPSKLSDWFEKCSCYCTSEKVCQDLQTGQSCTPCENYIHYFNAALLCGERRIEVEEDEDLILDCRLIWHVKLEDQYQFAFYKNRDLLAIKMSDDPFFVKKEMLVNDSDTYLCRTQLLSGIPVSILTFNVKVVKKATRTYKPRPTLPDIEPDAAHTAANVDIWKRINIHGQIITYVFVGFIIAAIAALSIYLLCKKDTIAKKDLEKEKKYLEDMEAMVLLTD